jgi:uncharacterized membrane protein
LGLNRSHTPALAVGIGAVAGLRTFTAPAVLAWAAQRRWIRMGNSPFATIISPKASKQITDFAVSELIADKLPFTPSRLKPGPFAARILSGAVCGVAIYSVVKRPLKEGAILGGLGAIAGAFAGYHVRRKLSADMPHLSVALLEDAVAIGGGILIAALAAPD